MLAEAELYTNTARFSKTPAVMTNVTAGFTEGFTPAGPKQLNNNVTAHALLIDRTSDESLLQNLEDSLI